MNKLRFIFALTFICFLSVDTTAQSLEWMSMEKAQKLASQNNKKVMLYAEAEWCGYCKKMNKQVFPQQTVIDSLQKYFYPVRIDIESDEKLTFNGEEYSERSLARKFRVTQTPTTVFLDPEGNVIGAQPGFLRTEIFDKLLAYVGNDLYGKIGFKEYAKRYGVELKP